MEYVEIPRGCRMRVHQTQIARHRHHIAISTAVQRGGCGGGRGGTLVIRPEHAHEEKCAAKSEPSIRRYDNGIGIVLSREFDTVLRVIKHNENKIFITN